MSLPRGEPRLWVSTRRGVLAGLSGLTPLLAAPAVSSKKKKRKRCRDGRQRCQGACRDLRSDAAHCGACGRVCATEETCIEGKCCAGASGCVGTCQGDCSSETVRRPFPQHLGYGAVVPDRWSQNELDDHVRAAYERWKTNYVVSAERSGDQLPRFRVAFGKPESGNHGTTVSEGQGFGMIAVAHMAGHDPQAQAIFDGLWRFTRDHPSAIDARLMDWRVPDRNGNASAFDGDCDMAYGLLLADAQWGSDGAVDYRAEFNRLIGGILASTIGPQSRLPMLGDWVTPNGAMHNQYSPRTSDFMPGHFRAFRRATGDSVWDEVIAACGSAIDRLQEHFSPQTGLLPDFVEPVSSTDRSPRPASPGFLEGPYDGAYRYNAGRDPWRLGVDALLSGDRSSASRARKISQWAMGATQGDVYALRAGYELNGTPLPGSTYFTTFFAAPLGVAAMTDATAQAWVNDIYAAVHDRSEGYYEDSVTLLCLLAMTGNWWSPD